jgi:hypothetical protein
VNDAEKRQGLAAVREGVEIMEETKLDALITLQKKQLLVSRIGLIAAAVFVVLVIVGAVLGFGAFGREMDELKQQNKALNEALRVSVEENGGEFDITPLVTAVNDIIGKVDIQGLNKTVTALKDAAANLSKIDTNHLNTLIDNLDEAAKGINDVIVPLKKLFGK